MMVIRHLQNRVVRLTLANLTEMILKISDADD